MCEITSNTDEVHIKEDTRNKSSSLNPHTTVSQTHIMDEGCARNGWAWSTGDNNHVRHWKLLHMLQSLPLTIPRYNHHQHAAPTAYSKQANDESGQGLVSRLDCVNP